MRRGGWLLVLAVALAACGGDTTDDTPATDDPVGSSAIGDTTAPAATADVVAYSMNRDGELSAVDPASGSLEMVADVENASFLWTIEGEPWVGHRERLIHFDTSGEERGSIDLWGPQSLAAGDGLAWVVSLSQSTPNGVLSRVDRAAHSTTGDVLTEDGVFFDDVATGDGLVWVSYDGLGWESTISAVDPESLAITNTIELPIDTRVMTYGEGSLWVAGHVADGDDNESMVVRVAADGTIEAEISLDAPWRQLDLLVAFGSAWVVDADGAEVVRIDPATNAEVGRFAAGSAAPTHPRRIRVFAGSGSLWVDNPVDDTVYEIDPATGEHLSSFGHRAIVFAFR